MKGFIGGIPVALLAVAAQAKFAVLLEQKKRMARLIEYSPLETMNSNPS
jgi:hypothetical protein